jgi:sialic acid synthase
MINEIYVIAEIGNNHQGNLKHALDLIKAAKDAGANAVKTQKRDNKSLYTKSFFNQRYDNPNSFAETYGLHREALELKKNDYIEMINFAKEIDIDFFATPFDLKSLEFLEQFNLSSYKIASADITNTILQEEIAKTNKEIFLSTGGATLNDVKRAKENIFKYNENLTILQCTASYPASVESMNLRVLNTYAKNFPGLRLGLSDHENGIDAGPIAYMLGARVFEKHFTLNRANKGTDNAFSLEPMGLNKFVRNLLRIEKLLGSSEKKQLDSEKAPLTKMRKSIVLSNNKKKGDTLNKKDISLKSPGLGLHPYEINKIIGKRLNKDLQIDDYITMDDLI